MVAHVFNSNCKLYLHVVQLVLVTAAIATTIARAVQPVTITRAHTMAIGMGLKSLVVIGYQLTTQHVRRFEKWSSLKANAILNGFEIMFWATVVYLLVQINTQICTGTACTLSWTTAVIAVVLTITDTWVFIISYRDFRHLREEQAQENRKLSESPV